MIAFWYMASSLIRAERAPDAIQYMSEDGAAYEIIGADELPEEPSPVMVTDQRGKSKWTISIPARLTFPLKPEQYRDICEQASDVAKHVAELKNPGGGHSHAGHYSYYHVDQNYMDVSEAEYHDLLPGTKKDKPKHAYLPNAAGLDSDVVGFGSALDSSKEQKKVCQTSLTYVLESEDAGLGNTLMGLWMSYGLAAKEGRAFFIEDNNWAYGNYTTYFQPPPSQSCIPPPRTQRVPCPRHANHLIVSSATVPWTFGHSFNEEFEDPHKMRVERQWPIFALAEHGYNTLFHLNDEDNKYLETRLSDLNSTIRDKNGIEIGVHVRHGDRHPLEFQYQKSYLPLSLYLDAAREILTSHFETDDDKAKSDDGMDMMMSEMSSKMLIASDDPAVYTAPELSTGLKAQSQISLAGKTAASPSPQTSAAAKADFTDHTGWEGGFYQNVFWGLGLDSSIPFVGGPAPSKTSKGNADKSKEKGKDNHPRRSFFSSSSEAPPPDRDPNDPHSNPPPSALHLRQLVGRAYLLDLAVLGQADAVVCGVSSVSCRVLAVMMGWEKAIQEGQWRNVDGDWFWKGIIW